SLMNRRRLYSRAMSLTITPAGIALNWSASNSCVCDWARPDDAEARRRTATSATTLPLRRIMRGISIAATFLSHRSIADEFNQNASRMKNLVVGVTDFGTPSSGSLHAYSIFGPG